MLMLKSSLRKQKRLLFSAPRSTLSFVRYVEALFLNHNIASRDHKLACFTQSAHFGANRQTDKQITHSIPLLHMCTRGNIIHAHSR